LSQIDSYVDVSEYGLLRIYELAINKSQESAFDADEIILGHYYSNGKYGKNGRSGKLLTNHQTRILIRI
jgi:hypothetical protein